jgi:uncharacterized circularly permuted ATP-grasp superfamily protein/uncharacterized alpha-E superfamily protein
MSNQAHLPLVLPSGGPSAEGYDEAFMADGNARGHWVAFMAHYQMLASAGLPERIERTRQLAADSGISLGYHATNPAAAEWLFDLIPLILTGAEYRYLEAAITQRARVLDRLLHDLYGPQETLRRGLFPPYLVYGNPDYLRPLREVAHAAGPSTYDPGAPPRWLQVYAVDLVRRPDGTWVIVSDKTQVPTGAGYAIANRRNLARALPEAFTNQSIRSCRPFFDDWAAGLKAAGRAAGQASPRVALLTPGPFAPGYFEHVYLAREMDLTLVEGSDLTVRGGKLLMKELGGLEPVDVLLRRLDGSFCDPLELRPDSLLGVTGLAHMQREERVTLANRIGSGAVETPALFPFMPRLIQEMLGETQIGVSAETWWCGQPAILEKILARLDDYIILPAFYGFGYPVDPAELSPSERAALVERIQRTPEAFVAQERLVPSNIPMVSGNMLQSHPVVLRMFAVAGENGFVVMPGGFARVPLNGSPFSGILADGSITKDVWVLADDLTAPSVQYPLPITLQAVDIVRSTGGLQSRVADNLFWLGRYMERIEVSARLCRSVYARILNANEGSREAAEIESLTSAFWRTGLVEWDTPILSEQVGQISEALLQATGMDGPISSDFRQVQRLMMGLRDRFSSDMWDILNEFTLSVHDRLQHAAGDLDLSLKVFDQIIHHCSAFAGMAAEGMVRGTGWRFMDFGRRLERALFGLRVASSCCGLETEQEAPHLRLALELGDALITYRNRYLSQLQPRPVLDLILGDETNPKSVLYQLQTLLEHAGHFPTRRNIDPSRLLQKTLTLMRECVDLYIVDPNSDPFKEDASAVLDAKLFECENLLHEVSTQLSGAYFLHSEGERLLRADWRPGDTQEGAN